MSNIPYPDSTPLANNNNRYHYAANHNPNASFDTSKTKLRGKLSTSLNMSHNYADVNRINMDCNPLNPLVISDDQCQPHHSRISNYTFSTNDTSMIHSTTNYNFSKDELSKYGTMNDLTTMQSNNMFNYDNNSHPQITRHTDPAGFKDMIREQMDQAKKD
jgi:hypothetical protein